MMDPAKLQRARAAFSLLRESISVVKGLKKVMAAPQQKTAGEASEKAAVAEASPESALIGRGRKLPISEHQL